MKNYFNDQIKKLHQDGLVYAKNNPKQARSLNFESIDDKDPHVERLLEGFAYLTAGIQQQLDNSSVFISEVILDNIYPEALLAYSSKIIAQFQLSDYYCEDHLHLSRDAIELISAPVGNEKTSIKFCLENDICLFPINLLSVHQDYSSDNLLCFNINFMTFENSISQPLQELLLYIDGDKNQKLKTFHLIYGALIKVELVVENQKIPLLLSHPYLNDSVENLLESCEFNMIRDFFCFPDKHMFVKLQVQEDFIIQGGEQFQIKFYVNNKYATTIMEDGLFNFKTGCVPMFNEFRYDAEPLYITNETHSYPLLVDSNRTHSIVLQSVESVIYANHSGLKTQCTPFSSYTPNSGEIYFRLKRSQDLARANEIVLTGDFDFNQQSYASINVKATNGFYPRKYLSIGDLSLSSKSREGNAVNGTNLTRPTEYYEPGIEQDYQFHLIGLFKCNLQNLMDVNTLKKYLNSHDLKNNSSHLIASILNVQYKNKQIIKKGILYHGVEIQIDIDDRTFPLTSEVFYFGMVLHHILLHKISFNQFIETIVHSVFSEVNYEWQSIYGNN